MPKKYSKSKKSSVRKTQRTRKSLRSRKYKSKTRTISLKNLCNKKLSGKIRKNIKEMKSGDKRIKSIKQAIAIAYSQIKKKFPKCKSKFKRS